MRRNRVSDHFSRICNDKHSDQKKFWNTIRPYISSRKKQTFYNERIVLKHNGGVIREQKKVAEVLAKFLKKSFTQDLLHTLKMFIITMSLHMEIIMGATQLSLV